MKAESVEAEKEILFGFDCIVATTRFSRVQPYWLVLGAAKRSAGEQFAL